MRTTRLQIVVRQWPTIRCCWRGGSQVNKFEQRTGVQSGVIGGGGGGAGKVTGKIQYKNWKTHWMVMDKWHIYPILVILLTITPVKTLHSRKNGSCFRVVIIWTSQPLKILSSWNFQQACPLSIMEHAYQTWNLTWQVFPSSLAILWHHAGQDWRPMFTLVQLCRKHPSPCWINTGAYPGSYDRLAGRCSIRLECPLVENWFRIEKKSELITQYKGR